MNSEADPRPIRARPTSIRRLGTVDCRAASRRRPAIPEALWNAEDAKQAESASPRSTRRGTSSFASSRTSATGGNSYDRPLWVQWKSLLEPVLAEAAKPYGYCPSRLPARHAGANGSRRRHSPAPRPAPGGQMAAQDPHSPANERPGDLLGRRHRIPPRPNARPSRSTTWVFTRSKIAEPRTAST